MPFGSRGNKRCMVVAVHRFAIEQSGELRFAYDATASMAG